MIILITYDGEDDDWNLLLKMFEIPSVEKKRIPFEELVHFLESFGKVTKQTIRIPVETPTREEMLQTLAFVASGGNPESRENFLKHSDKINSILDEKYKTANGYSFPFYHQFLVIQKTI